MWITVGDLDLVKGDGSGRDLLDVEDGGPIPAVLRKDPALAKVYATRTSHRIAAQEAYFRSRGVSHCRVTGADEVVPALLRLLQRRRRAGF